MDQYSAFQLANPLSPKKFWKKMLSQMLPLVFLCGFFLVMFLIYWYAATAMNTSGGSLLVAALLLPFLVFIFVFVGSWLYYKAYIRRYYYDAGEQFITIKKGVFTPTEIHVQYAKIQDVYVDQDLLDRFIGLYDVHIASATATSGIEAHIDGVEKDVAERIKQTFLGRITGQSQGSVMASATQSTTSTSLVSLTDEISSRTYPMAKRVLVLNIVGNVLSSLLVLIAFFGLVIGRNPEIATLLSGRFVVVACVFMGVILICTITGSVLWFKNFYFSFESGMIVLKTKVISTSETHLPYSTIQDVIFAQGILERVFGLATVRIQNASQVVAYSGRGQTTMMSGGITLSGQNVNKAKELVEIVRGIIQKTHTPSSTGL